jgi:hypothetical protein
MANENILANVPNVVTAAFAAIGLLYLSSKIVNYVYLLLELFVLSGTSVSYKPIHLGLLLYFDSSANMVSQVPGLLSPEHPTALAKNSPSNSPRKDSTSSSSRVPNRNFKPSLKRLSTSMRAHRSRRRSSPWTSQKTTIVTTQS